MMTAEQLKASILQLAMQGKMTKQKVGESVPKDFTASSYDGPFEIPETWVWTGAKNCGEIVVGATPKTANNEYWTNGDIKWLASGCCQDCQVFDTDRNLKLITKAGYNSCSTQLMPIDTVLIALTGATAGKVGLLKTEACANQSVVGITAVNGLMPEYLYYHLMSRRQEILDDCRGSAQPHISKKYITEMVFAIPPFEEQKRIVAKIEELMPFVDQYAAASNKLDTLNESFPDMMRKSILQEAVQGKLVPQDPNDEPASELLKRIAKGKEKLVREGKIKKQKALPEITEEEIPFDIPQSWKWVRFGTICTKLTDGSHNPPAKASLGYRVISAKNIKDGKIRFREDDRLASQEGFEKENPRTQISRGDVMLGIIGGSIGNTAIYDHDEQVIAQRSIAIIRSPINSHFIKALLDSPLLQQQLNKNTNGSAQGGVYLGTLVNMLIPLPPEREQEKILQRLYVLEKWISELDKGLGK